MKLLFSLAVLHQIAQALLVSIDRPSFNNLADDDSVILQAQHESYIDSLYGELVNNDETMAHKMKLVNSGEVFIDQPVESSSQGMTMVEALKQFETDEEIVEFLKQVKSGDKPSDRSHRGYLKYRLKLNLPDDDETSDLINGNRNLFGGIVTFGHFKHFDCFNPDFFEKEIDIAIVGSPFDTGTSYRPGARMGPEAIRSAGRRLGEGITPVRGNGKKGSKLVDIDPYNKKSHNLSIVDCGDVPMTPFDNRIALNQLYRGQRSIHRHPSKQALKAPKIITMGGDHTITLMTIKSAYETYGPLAVLHFDSHIDTWDPKVLGGGISHYMSLNHGTFLHYAAEQGYLAKDHCSHVGLRAPYIDSKYDIDHDKNYCGFNTITARDMDNLGIDKIIEKLKELVGDRPVYISVDIDVLDPASAPGTGTMEIGGWTSRELISVLDGLEGINLVGGDIVEVSPPYDSNSEITSLAATAVIDSMLGLMVVKELE